MVSYFGITRSIPMDLDAEANESQGATCHVCGSPAKVIVEMLDAMSAIGSAIYLCEEDFRLASDGNQESLGGRLAKNYQEPISDVRATAVLMTEGTGRAVRLPDVPSE